MGLVLTASVNAAEQSDAQVSEWQKKCESIAPIDSVYFQSFAEKILKSKQLFCHFSIEDDEAYLQYFSQSFELLLPYVDNQDAINRASLSLQRFINAGKFPQVIYEKSDADVLINMVPIKLLRQQYQTTPVKRDSQLLNSCDKKAQSVEPGSNCDAVLQEFVNLFNEAQSFYSLYTAVKTQHQLQTVIEQWDDYLAQSRSQTALELLVNGYFYKKKEAVNFNPPPNGQLILLHPGLIIEDVSGAADGENTQQALMIEVIGYNWWRQDSWFIPSGVSYTRIYADRAGVKDWGDGISLHFRSQFTLGYSKHKDEEGVYISVDLLKLFEDKQKVFDEFKLNF
jgi:hypothetical protein